MTLPDDFDAADALFAEISALPESDPRRAELRDKVVTILYPLVRSIAAKFRGRGEHMDDLQQVAAIGLVKAVDRFDPERGSSILGYAIPTMMGEVRRYFRDKAWSVKVPRRLSELYVSLNSATRELSQQLGRAPTPRELADRLQIGVEEVLEGLEAGQYYRSTSLDASADSDESTALVMRLGSDDPELALAEERAMLQPALAKVPERERRILAMRFFQGLTQTQIADRIGLSQMQVSRLLAKTLQQLRTDLEEPGPPE